MSESTEPLTQIGGAGPSEISDMSTGTETFDKNGGDARASGMTMSLIIKYLQENRELRMRMRMRMRIMLEGRTAINRSDISSGVMSPTRPGSLHPEQLI